MLKIKPPNYKYCPFCGKILRIKIEESNERKYCPDDNWTYYPIADQASNAIIVRNRKILLVKRAREPYRGNWQFPAGFVNFGEHPKETIIREVSEETGLITKDAVFFDVLQTTDDPRSPGNMTFYYTVSIEGSSNLENGDKDENSDIQWFELDNVPPIAWKDHKAIIEKLQLKHPNTKK